MNANLYRILKRSGFSRQGAAIIAAEPAVDPDSGDEGDVLTLYKVPGQNQIQTITNTGDLPTAGTFTISLGDQTTGDLDFDALSADIETELEGLSNIGAGNVTVAGATLDSGNPTVTFLGDLAQTTQELLVVDATDLTGDVDISSVESQEAIADGPVLPVWRAP